MSILKYKTRGMTNPQGLPRVYFSCHSSDFDIYFEPVSDEILRYQNCAIYYMEAGEQFYKEQELLSDLSQMQLFVMPVTTKLLTDENRVLELEFPFAMKEHIPVLPLMQERGLEELFNEKCGDLQFLDKNQRDATAIDYGDKLEKYLASVLIGDEMSAKVRAAFDAYVFLSYRKKDRKYAQELMYLIHKNDFCRDIAIWYDEFLTPGENFNDAISDALRKSELFALVVTPNLVNETNYVMTTEYPMAREAEKWILPAEIVPTDRKELHKKYKNIPPCTDAHNEAELSESLLEAIQNMAVKENDKDPEHNFFIGLAYLSGIDVEVNKERAVELMKGSAEAGIMEAVEKLVQMYRNGEGVKRNYETAVEWQEKLVEQQERKFNAGEGGEKFISSLEKLGDYLRELGKMEQAKMAYKRIIGLFGEQCTEDFRKKYKRDLAVSYRKIGSIEREEGNLKKAKAYSLESLRIFEEVSREKESSEAFRDVALCYESLGRIAEDEWNLEEAGAYYEKSLEVYQKLAETKGNLEVYLDLSIGYKNLGYIQEIERNPEEAEIYYRKSLEVSERLVKEVGTLRARRELADSYGLVGNVEKDEGRLIEAEIHYKKSLKIYEELLEEAGMLDDYIELAQNYKRLGDVERKKGNPEEAKVYYKKGLEIREDLIKKVKTVNVCRDLYISYNSMGNIEKAANNIKEAKRYYGQYLLLSKELAEKTGLMECKRDLSVAYEKMGDLERTEENWNAARGYYEKTMEINEELERETGTRESKRDLSVIYNRLGMVEEAEENFEGAKAYYRKCIEIREKLAEETKAVNIYDDLALSYYRYGSISSYDIAILKKAYDIWNRLSVQCPDVVSFARRRNMVKNFLLSNGFEV